MPRSAGAGHGGLHCDLDRVAVMFRILNRRPASATTILPMSKEDARFWALLRTRRNSNPANGKDAA